MVEKSFSNILELFTIVSAIYMLFGSKTEVKKWIIIGWGVIACLLIALLAMGIAK